MVRLKIVPKTLFLLFLYLNILSVCHGLTINEIYPAPSGGESEWVEIYNETDSQINLDDYLLTDEKNQIIAFESNIIEPKGFQLALSTNILNNSGDTITLKKTSGETIDSSAYQSGLNDKKSLARCPDGGNNWVTTETITKKASNQAVCTTPQTPTPQETDPTGLPITPQPEQQPVSTAPTTTTQQFSNDIYLSEVMAYPSASYAEWVEIYNNSNLDISLSNWFIDDGVNTGSAPKSFSTYVKARGFAVVELSTSILNNDTDVVRLLDPDQNLKDSIAYNNPIQNKSIGRTSLPNGATCSQEPSPGEVNKSCINNEPTAPKNTTNTQTQTGSTKNPTAKPNITQKIANTPKNNLAIGMKTQLTDKQQSEILQNYQTDTYTIGSNSSVLGASDKASQVDKQLLYIKITALVSFFIALSNNIYMINKIVSKIKISQMS